jgi:surface antigen
MAAFEPHSGGRTMPAVLPRSSLLKALAASALALAVAAPHVLAAPPAHAPAHGWRKKNDPNYVGYTGRKWDKDYGVIGGRCNREAVGAVLGGVVGGAIGSRVGEGDGRAVAIVVGSVLGAVIGAQIGRDLDEADRACVGHALELAVDGKQVVWSNAQTGMSYALTPTRGFRQNGQSCREFTTVITAQGRRQKVTDRACRTGDGTWRIVS